MACVPDLSVKSLTRDKTAPASARFVGDSFPSDVCVAGGVATFVVGCYLVSVGMACFTHRHTVVVTGLLHPPPHRRCH